MFYSYLIQIFYLNRLPDQKCSKNNPYNISNKIKKEYIDWLENTVYKRVDAIVSNKYRCSYGKAAFLVCIFDECMENLKIKNKGEIIEFYENKYLRYTAFKKEINKYK